MRRPRFLLLLSLPALLAAPRPATAASPVRPFAGGAMASSPGPFVPDGGRGPASALECLAIAIAYEAGHEPIEGRRAVADVILNRARSGVHPATVCGVVYEGSQRRTGCQFTFTCDGSLRRVLPVRVMDEARQIAQEALAGASPSTIGDAINYHADYVSPYWASSMVRVARIGRHIFYRSTRSQATAPYQPAGTGLGEPRSPAATSPASSVFAPWGISLGQLR